MGFDSGKRAKLGACGFNFFLALQPVDASDYPFWAGFFVFNLSTDTLTDDTFHKEFYCEVKRVMILKFFREGLR